MSPNRRILLNIVATYGRSLYALVCGLFISRWVLAALGKTDFGLYGLVGGLTVFISFLNGLLSQATGRFYAFSIGEAIKCCDSEKGTAIELDRCQQWFSTAVFLHTIVPVFLMLVGYPIGVYAVKNWLTIPPERLSACIWIFRFVCVSCFISMINVPFQAMYIAKQYIAELTLYSFLQTTANFILVCFMSNHPGDWLTKYAFWMCILMILPQIVICIRAIAVFPECKLRTETMWNTDRVVNMAKYAFWQGFGTLGVALRGQGIQLLINGYYEPSINASFTIANQVATQSQALSASLQGAFAPAITTACGGGKMDEMRNLAYRTCKLGLLLALIFVLPLALELRTVLDLWLVNTPPYTAELCWSVLLMTIVDKSASGHMLAVGANGKIATYQAFLGGSLILTLPIAWLLVSKGLGVASIGYSMVLTMMLCAWGRVWFARKLVGMSARYWMFKIMLPMVIVVGVVGVAGFMVRFVMASGLICILATTIVCEVLLIPLAWFFLLDASERLYFTNRIGRLFHK